MLGRCVLSLFLSSVRRGRSRSPRCVPCCAGSSARGSDAVSWRARAEHAKADERAARIELADVRARLARLESCVADATSLEERARRNGVVMEKYRARRSSLKHLDSIYARALRTGDLYLCLRVACHKVREYVRKKHHITVRTVCKECDRCDAAERARGD